MTNLHQGQVLTGMGLRLASMNATLVHARHSKISTLGINSWIAGTMTSAMTASGIGRVAQD